MQNPLSILQGLSQAIGQARDPQALFEAVRQAVCEQWGQEIGLVIAFYDPAIKQVQLPFVWENDEQVQAETYVLGEDTISQVIRTRRPVLQTEIPDEKERFVNISFSSRMALSLIAAPLSSHAEVIGAVVVQDFSRGGHFSADDLLFLNHLAALFATQLTTSRVLDQLRGQMNRDKQLYEAVSRIRGSMDMQTILNVTAEELGKVLGARGVHISIEIPELLQPGLDEAAPPMEQTLEAGGSLL